MRSSGGAECRECRSNWENMCMLVYASSVCGGGVCVSYIEIFTLPLF